MGCSGGCLETRQPGSGAFLNEDSHKRAPRHPAAMRHIQGQKFLGVLMLRPIGLA